MATAGGRTTQGAAHVRSLRTSPCTMSWTSGPPQGAAGMHGETSVSCATVTMSLSASSTRRGRAVC